MRSDTARRALQETFYKAMHIIDNRDEPVALWLVDGKLLSAGAGQYEFERRMKKLRENMVGLYTQGVDARLVLEDLREFYK